METKLARISEVAKQNPDEVFTSLYHYLNKEMLIICHFELEGNKASGVDEVTKQEYEDNLRENVIDLVERLKRHAYKPKPVRRTYIPKSNGKQRPLGIPSYEDKLVQLGLTKILEAIYEPYFMKFSYGFRPNRSCHDALKELNSIIEEGKINYVVDADIKGFFDNVNHDWLLKFIGHRIADPNIKRLIVRFLKAGVMEDGKIEPSEIGTPQGGVVSPILANIYLHYVLDLWFERIVKKYLQGQAEIVRYADDYVCCFQKKKEAYKFYRVLKKRLAKFKLEIAEEKTSIIAFGRFAERNCKEGKPKTFDFLGFTHYCSKSRKGRFRVKRKTNKKKFRAKVRAFKEWIKLARYLPMEEIIKTIKSKLTGHFQYYGITDNSKMICKFRHRVIQLIYKWVNRRSQRRSFNYKKLKKYLDKNSFPKARIYVNIYG